MAYNLDLLTDNKLVLSKKSELPYTKCINRIRIPTKKERAVVNEKKSDFLMFGGTSLELISAVFCYCCLFDVQRRPEYGLYWVPGHYRDADPVPV